MAEPLPLPLGVAPWAYPGARARFAMPMLHLGQNAVGRGASGWLGGRPKGRAAMLLAARALLDGVRQGAPEAVAGGLVSAQDIAPHRQPADESVRLVVSRSLDGQRIGLQDAGTVEGFHVPAETLAALCLRTGVPARGPGGYEIFPIWRRAPAGPFQEPQGLMLPLEHDDGVTLGLLRFLLDLCGFLDIPLRNGSFSDC
jgi:hypothetical protein